MADKGRGSDTSLKKPASTEKRKSSSSKEVGTFSDDTFSAKENKKKNGSMENVQVPVEEILISPSPIRKATINDLVTSQDLSKVNTKRGHNSSRGSFLKLQISYKVNKRNTVQDLSDVFADDEKNFDGEDGNELKKNNDLAIPPPPPPPTKSVLNHVGSNTQKNKSASDL